jgi:hypothetical protein
MKSAVTKIDLEHLSKTEFVDRKLKLLVTNLPLIKVCMNSRLSILLTEAQNSLRI